MNDFMLDNDEQSVLKAYEADAFVSVTDLEKRKQELQEIAKTTLNKTKNINIRISERGLYRLKAKAVEEVIPYQTLAASILHKSTAK